MKKEKHSNVEIVLNVYNAQDLIDAFFQSLKKQTYSSFSILVIDDGSTDDTIKKIKPFQEYFDLKIIKNPHQGLRKARKFGITRTNADIIVILDADLQLDKNAIKALLTSFHSDKKIAAVGGILKGQAKTITAKSYAALRHYFIKLRQKNKQADWLSGGFCAYKKQAIEDTTGFSEDTTSADLDISWKLKKQGYRLVITDDAIAYHDDPNTLKEVWNREKNIGQREYYLTRHYPKQSLTLKRLIRFYPFLTPFFLLLLFLYWPIVAAVLLISLLGTMALVKETIQIRLLSWITFHVMNVAYCTGFLHSMIAKEK